jgi:hypothetical protein
VSANTSPVAADAGRSPSSESRLGSDRRHGSSGPSAWSWLLIAVVVAYLLLPGHPRGLLRGVPLDTLDLGALLVLGIGLFGFGRPLGWRWLRLIALVALALLAIKLLLWWSAPSYGLAASYFARSRPTGPIERSTEARSVPYTRVEASPGRGGPALHFFNDVERFNFYESPDPDRQRLPFAVRWDGYLQVPRDGTYPLALTARGVASLSLDGSPVLTVGARDAEARDAATVSLTAGPHPLRLELLREGAADPSMSVDLDTGAGPRPLAPPLLTVEPTSADVLSRDRVLSTLAVILDVLVLACITLAILLAAFGCVRATLTPAISWGGMKQPAPPLHRNGEGVGGWGLSRERPLLALWLLVVLAYALITTASLAGRAVILEGGQDWLTYESYARDILLNGPLMTLGKPLGEGRPFFFQPFYPYALAGMHWLAGEGVWGPIVLQLVGDGVAGVLLYFLAKRLFGVAAGIAALALFAILMLSQLDWVARKLLSENLYFVLLPAAVLLIVRAIDERRWRDVVWAGLLLGLASITRAPTLLYVPWVAIIVAHGWWRVERSISRALLAFVLLGALTASIAALVPIRNFIVSGRPALVATNGGATLLLAHQPTDKVRLGGVDRDPVYNALKLDRQTREVVEFARQDPLGYLWTLVPLGLYSIGVSGAVEGFPPLAPDILAISGLYLVGLLTLPGTRTLRAVPVRLFVGLHLAIMVTFLPYVYGYRQVLPMQLLMLVFGGALIGDVAGRLVGRGARQARVDATVQPVVEQSRA